MLCQFVFCFDHILCLFNEASLLFVNKLLQVVTDSLIGGVCLHDDEIEEEDARHVEGDEVDSPEEDALTARELRHRLDNGEVAHGQPKGPDEASYVKSNGKVHIFFHHSVLSRL